MKITRDKMFFSKDLIHTLAYVGMFVAAIISVGACKSGIWVAAILAWIVAGIIIGLAIISDYKKAELLKNGTRIIGKVTATKRVHIKFHMSTYHLADEDVIYPYVVHYQYKVKGETYNGKSQWFWFNPCIPKGAPIKILVRGCYTSTRYRCFLSASQSRYCQSSRRRRTSGSGSCG